MEKGVSRGIRMCRKNHIVHITKRIYDYDDMRKDIWNLWKRYPEFWQVQILGKTLEKRNMYGIRLGSRKAKRNVIVELNAGKEFET